MTIRLDRMVRGLGVVVMIDVLLISNCQDRVSAPPGADALARRTFALAQTGRADAEYAVSLLFNAASHGFPHDTVESMRWLRRAARQGYASAEADLGYRLLRAGRQQDAAEAHQWLLAAARYGNANAEYRLATTYVTGEGTKPDPIKAYVWARMAKAAGSPDAEEIIQYAVSRLSIDDFASAVRLYRKLRKRKGND